MRKLLLPVLVAGLIACAGRASDQEPAASASSTTEPRLANVRMLTKVGENAEAYFSFDGKRLIYQSTSPPDVPCDQIFSMDLTGSDVKRLSNGKGRTTCAYYYPAGDKILYASTHHVSDSCPPSPDFSQGYVWALYDYDIFVANADGSGAKVLAGSPGYDAEATMARDGRVVFTSTRDGDLDLYVMDSDGGKVRRLTTELGYDGGAFFSADGTQIVYRAFHPETEAEVADYKALLERKLIRPTKLDIFVMNADGSNKRRLTTNGAANFAPFFHPDGKRVIFSSNVGDTSGRGRNFDLYLINVDGTGLERITTHDLFDGFPMFSPDGKQLVFASNRDAAKEGDTNIFLADWVDSPRR